MQVENRIEQDITITEQLALWGRGGSTVIRGNLLMIPIEDSFLYVEPVFLQGATGGVPELKRVIVATGDAIAMEKTLEEALAAVFGEAPPDEEPPDEEPPDEEPPPDEELPSEIAELVQLAQEHYNQAFAYLAAGDLASFQTELEAMASILDQLAELTEQ